MKNVYEFTKIEMEQQADIKSKSPIMFACVEECLNTSNKHDRQPYSIGSLLLYRGKVRAIIALIIVLKSCITETVGTDLMVRWSLHLESIHEGKFRTIMNDCVCEQVV